MAFETVAGYLYTRLREAGATIEATSALLAQVQKESLFIVNNVEDGRGWSDEGYTIAVDSGAYTEFDIDGIGYGLYQLTYRTRKKAFWDFVRNRGCSISDLEAQVDYMIFEFQQMFPSIWRMMATSHDLYYCTKELLYKWENPQEKEENLKERYTYAQKWLDMAQALEESENQNISTGSDAPRPISTTDAAIQKVISLAQSEVGYHEKASNAMLDDKTANSGSGNYTKYGKELDALPTFYNGKKNGYAWCDQFVDWLFFKCFGANAAMQMLCQPKNSAGAGCMYSKSYYQAQGRFDRTPHVGDQIFFYDSSYEINHTGIVESVDDDQVNTIEGNSSDRVQRQSYLVNSGYIAGYGHPKWELAASAATSTIEPVSSSNSYIREGMKGTKVQLIQTYLKKLNYDIGPYGVDGDFGSDTRKAVMCFQRDHDLTPNGIIDEKTLDVLNAEYKQINKATVAPQFRVNDVVTFTGTQQFISSTSTRIKPAKPGKAKITIISPGAPHPYHLVRVPNGGSNIYGWVDEKDISKIV